MLTSCTGGALFISVGQNIFTNKLLTNLKHIVPGIDPALVLKTGATSLKDVIPSKYYGGVLIAYNDAIQNVFYVAVAMAVLSAFGAVFVEWKSVKGKKIAMAAA